MLLPVTAVLSALITIVLLIFGVFGQIYYIPLVFVVSFLVLILCCVIFFFICTRFIDTKKKCVKHSLFFRACSNCIIGIVMQALRIKLHVTGMELLPEEKFMLAGNHRGAMDPLLTMNVLRKYHMGFVAKKEICRIPIVGRLMHKCFCLSLDRDNIREEVKTINQAAEIIKTQTASIGIYPEGTRNPTNELLPFMNGAFKIAKKAECPIVVAVIRNPELVMKRAPFRKTDVYLDFIDVLSKDFVNKNSTVQISEQTRKMIEMHLSLMV
ncbi:MAG: lysophospholipid acyltransferase family protein [Ruminococcus sp.]